MLDRSRLGLPTWPLVSFIVCLIFAALSSSGCAHRADARPDTKDAKADLPTIKADVITVHPVSWPLTVRAHGSLVADEIALVGAEVAGRVAEVHVDLGDFAKAGEKLITLDQEEFVIQAAQAEAQLNQAFAAVGLKPGDSVDKLNPANAPPSRRAKAEWDEAKLNLARAKQLLSQNATSESEYEQFSTAERVAEAQYAASINSVNEKIAEIGVRSAELSLAKQRLKDTVIEAPFTGLIQQRHVAPGTFVQIGSPMVTIVRTDQLRFRATIPERHAKRLAVGQDVHLRTELNEEPRKVKITRISPAVDELSRALLFEALVDNSDGSLRTGLFAEAEVVLDPETVTIAVPADAVSEFAGVEKIWKVVDGVAQEQVVQTGQRRNNEVQILSGLSSGDMILREAKLGRVARIAPTTTVVNAE